MTIDFSKIDWAKVLDDVNSGVQVLAPVVGALLPETAVAAEIIKKIIAGAAASEPAAVALYNQIIGGQDVTEDQLKAYIADNEAANDELHDEIVKQLAT